MSEKSGFGKFLSFLNGLAWLVIVGIILSLVGQKLIRMPESDKQIQPPTSKPIVVKPVDWDEVDQEIAAALEHARLRAEEAAAQALDGWVEKLMTRVDDDFLPWYFDYWNQQLIGLKGLYHSVLHYLDETQPTASEKITEEIQREFANRVLQPQLAQFELEKITNDAVNVYVAELRSQLSAIPERYNIPREKWSWYLHSIAVMTEGVEGNRRISLTLKTLTASSVGGAVLLAKPIKAIGLKMGSALSTKLAAKSTAKMAAKTGQKVAGKAGGKLLGPIVGIAIIIWDVMDHQATKEEAMPLLRENIALYLVEVRDSMIYDAETGVVSVLYEIENNVVASLRDGKNGIESQP